MKSSFAIFFISGGIFALELSALGWSTLPKLDKPAEYKIFMNTEYEQKPAEVKAFCAEVLKDGAFQTTASAFGISMMKSAAVREFCRELDLQNEKKPKDPVGKLGEKKEFFEPVFEPAPQILRTGQIPDFSKKNQSIADDQKQLDTALVLILDNAELQGKKETIRERLAAAQKKLEEIKGIYDAVVGDKATVGSVEWLREDLKDFRRFKVFKPAEYATSSPEEYIEALDRALEHESYDIFNERYKKIVRDAIKSFKEAKENLESVRQDLQRFYSDSF